MLVGKRFLEYKVSQQMESYLDLHPSDGESKFDYARRLETDGHDEMFIRAALRFHFSMQLTEFSDFFEDFEIARLRHVEAVSKLRKYPNEGAFARKVGANLGISTERAKTWVRRYKAFRSSSSQQP